MWEVGASKRPAIVSKHKWETVEAIKALAEIYGMTTYELSGMTTKMNLEYPGKMYAQHLIEEHKVNFSLHAEFFTVVMCNEAKEYDEYSMENSLTFAKWFNCPIVVHPGGQLTNSPTQLSHVINNLERAITNTGIDPTLIYIETMGKTDQFGTLLHCINIHKALGTRICVDWAHLYARYMADYGSFTKEMVQNTLEVMELLDFPQEQYYHISNIKFNHKGEVKHLPFNETDFYWKMVLDEIKATNLSGRIIVECGYVNETLGIKDPTGEYVAGTRLIKDYMNA